MPQIPGAEAFVRMLQRHGVKHVFGLCGDTSLPLYDALYRGSEGAGQRVDSLSATNRWNRLAIVRNTSVSSMQ